MSKGFIEQALDTLQGFLGKSFDTNSAQPAAAAQTLAAVPAKPAAATETVDQLIQRLSRDDGAPKSVVADILRHAATTPPTASEPVPVLVSPQDLLHGAQTLERLAAENNVGTDKDKLHREQLAGRAQQMRTLANG